MKVNFNKQFVDFLGNPILDKEGKEQIIGKSLGLRLFNMSELDGKELTPEEKYLAYRLSVKIGNADAEVEIDPEETEFIDRCSSRFYNAGAYGNIKSLITQ